MYQIQQAYLNLDNSKIQEIEIRCKLPKYIIPV